jgi:hypothetical protein
MENPLEPHVEDADRTESGVLVTFKDAIGAVFSVALLYLMLPQAERVVDDFEDAPEE